MKTLLPLVFFLILLANQAYSCRCLIIREFSQVLDNSDQIFIGKVTAKNKWTLIFENMANLSYDIPSHGINSKLYSFFVRLRIQNEV